MSSVTFTAVGAKDIHWVNFTVVNGTPIYPPYEYYFNQYGLMIPQSSNAHGFKRYLENRNKIKFPYRRADYAPVPGFLYPMILLDWNKEVLGLEVIDESESVPRHIRVLPIPKPLDGYVFISSNIETEDILNTLGREITDFNEIMKIYRESVLMAPHPTNILTRHYDMSWVKPRTAKAVGWEF